MLNLTIDHFSTLARAETLFIRSIAPNMYPNHRKAIEDDLERLAEMKKHVLDLIYTPDLPLKPGPWGKGTPNGNKSKTS